MFPRGLLAIPSAAALILIAGGSMARAQSPDLGADAARTPPADAFPPPDGLVAADFAAPHSAEPRATAGTAPSPLVGPRAKRVLIISEDGLRPDVLTALHLPWHESLWRHGSYSWKAQTIRTASTLPAHAAMLSGMDVDAHGLSWNNWQPSRGYIKVPTIFAIATAHHLTTAMFVGKWKLRHIATPGSVGVFERPGYYCNKVATAAAAYFVAEKPALTFVHFSDPDEAGHAKGWSSEAYRRAVAHSDRCLGILLAALDSADLTRDTLILVSADHGGHNHTHSGKLRIDREIPWIAHGPGVREGYRIHAAITTVDTAATALFALGLPIPQTLVGKPVREIFRDGGGDLALP